MQYLNSGEYYNQLRFERDMLQDLADKGEISKEDKEFIDCTHRNTELLEIINKAIEILNKWDEEYNGLLNKNVIYISEKEDDLFNLLKILKGENND